MNFRDYQRGGLRGYLAKSGIIKFPGSKGGHGYFNDESHWEYGDRPVAKDAPRDENELRPERSETPEETKESRKLHRLVLGLTRYARIIPAGQDNALETGLMQGTLNGNDIQCHVERGLFHDDPQPRSWLVVDDPRLSQHLIVDPGHSGGGRTKVMVVGRLSQKAYRPRASLHVVPQQER